MKIFIYFQTNVNFRFETFAFDNKKLKKENYQCRRDFDFIFNIQLLICDENIYIYHAAENWREVPGRPATLNKLTRASTEAVGCLNV